MRSRHSPYHTIHTAPAVLTALAAAVVFAGCTANAGMVVRADRSASLSVALSLGPAIEEWVRSVSGTGAVMVDAQAIAQGARRSGLAVTESKATGPSSWRGSFTIENLGAFCAQKRDAVPADDMGLRGSPAGSLSELGLLRFERGPGWASLRLRLDRGNAGTLMALLPLADREVTEALMPPAVYDNPVSLAQFRQMMEATMGSTVNQAVFSFSLTLPGPILEKSGPSAQVSADGRSVGFSLPMLEAMVLERPVELYARWKE